MQRVGFVIFATDNGHLHGLCSVKLDRRIVRYQHLSQCPALKCSIISASARKHPWRTPSNSGTEDLAHGHMHNARTFYAEEDLRLELENTLYALNSTTINLSPPSSRGPSSKASRQRSICILSWI